ncbi:SufS family cysteine desulfurase [Candidatus Karelsulcia muelleri]|uniref:SufS family cysteine desulfurase n=1 Tax=Candidatus Karelsulcia muelleri TaxID=336810 RepID=UPI000D7BEE6A|nr:SufS family cysteine desulfurase [Candidatus Karelsulcia muelleri]
MFSKKEIKSIRNQFPILNTIINNRKLIYFDNAATTQKPKQIINSIKKFYYKINSNVHRGAHFLSKKATEKMELSRKRIKFFLNAKSSHEIIFTSGATESINLIANSISDLINKNDEILIPYSEHHSNIIPWQILCKKKKAFLKIIPIDNNGNLKLEKFKSILSKRTKLISLSHVSNALGIINPINKIIFEAKKYNILVVIDGSQAISHIPINIKKINTDFYVFSIHKMYGPTGIGVLYGKEELLKLFSPYKYGGEMIKKVLFEKTTYANLPFKLEAGTPNIEGIISTLEVIKFIKKYSINNIKIYENKIMNYATKLLNSIKGIKIYGKVRSNIISFNIKNIHPFDGGQLLDNFGIAVRTGNHCAQPLMRFFSIPGTIRISFAIYNSFEEIDFLFKTILKIKKIL